MKTILHNQLGLIVFALMLAVASASSQTTQPTTALSYTPEQFRDGAEKTNTNFNIGWRERGETQRDPIPAKYWDDAIRSLNPIRVYSHRANIVVVQREKDGVEEGKYFYLMISSYLPKSGIDGFELTPNPQQGTRYTTGTGVWDYTRTKEK